MPRRRRSSTRSPTLAPIPSGGSPSTSNTLRTTSKITVFDPPTHFEVEVVGDLTGTGKWTLAPNGKGTIHVRFDWIVHADRPLLRYLTPILRPIFRWNHNWSAARAKEGLDGYARSHSG